MKSILYKYFTAMKKIASCITYLPLIALEKALIKLVNTITKLLLGAAL